MAKTVTMPDGSKRTITDAHSADAVANEYIAQSRTAGRDIDQAATYQAFLQLSDRETAFYDYSPQGATVKIDPATQRLLSDPLANASYGIFTSVPTWLQKPWKAASDVATEEAHKLADLFGKVPGLSFLGDHLELAAIAALALGAVGAVFAVKHWKTIARFLL